MRTISEKAKFREDIRAETSKSLIRWKRLKGGKGGKRRERAEKGGKRRFDLEIDFWQKKFLISGDVLNLEFEGQAQSHDNVFKKTCFLNAHIF